MCGLCGVVQLDAPPDVAGVMRMSKALGHRGPDGDDVFSEPGVAIGHRRLAIIDLSDAGLQPFVSDDGRLRLVHNGEIYNYRELRSELEGRGHRFRTATDTEVLLEAYREWGPRCVERFNGMWAFVIWDSDERRLFASRDRFGVKPFYYRLDGDRLTFASELKAFGEGMDLRPNLRAVRDYVEQGYLDHTQETFFSGITSLAPGHSLTFDGSGLRIERYWRLEPREDRSGDPIGRMRELFVDAVRLRLRSDVPVGTSLSGGLDSSAVAGAIDLLLRMESENALPVGERQRTFTVYFEDSGFDERPYAEEVASQIRSEPHWVTYGTAELAEHLPAIVRAQDEPFGSPAVVSGWFVMRAAAREGMKVMLDGQGGDETLAGYTNFYGARIADLLLAARLGEVRRELSAYRSLQGVGAATAARRIAQALLPPALRLRVRARFRGSGALVHPALRDLPASPPNGSPFSDRLRSELYTSLTYRLPELLHYEDRNSMAHSIEARLPFLDYRLVEFLYSLDASHLLHRGTTKAILRDALADVIPQRVRDRTDKLGFVTPGDRFFRGDLGTHAAEVFASRSFAERGFVDAPSARALLARHRRGEVSAGFELWRALNVELWAQEFLDR